MASDREKLEDETLEQLADRMQDGPDSQRRYYAPLAELERRKTIWQLEACKAQKEAAEATKETAKYAKQNARYMLWSVIAILVTSGASALFQFLSWRFPR
jgi:hypothetical protein